jgi:hypothetical protein
VVNMKAPQTTSAPATSLDAPRWPVGIGPEAFAEEIDSLERFDHRLAIAEARRNNALRAIDRHRSALGAAVRQVVDEVEGEFRDVETGEVTGGPSP